MNIYPDWLLALAGYNWMIVLVGLALRITFTCLTTCQELSGSKRTVIQVWRWMACRFSASAAARRSSRSFSLSSGSCTGLAGAEVTRGDVRWPYKCATVLPLFASSSN